MSVNNVVMVSPEIVPFSKVGGLGDVIGALPSALARQGVDISVVSFLYSSIKQDTYGIKPTGKKVMVSFGDKEEEIEIYAAAYKNVSLYFLYHAVYSHKPYIEFIDPKRTNKEYQALVKEGVMKPLPTEDQGEIHFFMHRLGFEQAMALSKGALEAVIALELNPDIVHGHDWQTGVIPYIMKRHPKYRERFARTASVFTIHNLAYQGRFNSSFFALVGVDEPLSPENSEFFGDINCMKTGIIFADAVNTVSQRYAEEITTPEYGEQLDKDLRYLMETKQNLKGILNGADYDEWGPEHDSYLEYLEQLYEKPFLYSSSEMSGKTNAKKELQRVYKLPEMDDVMLIGTVSRFTKQKGFDLFVQIGKDLADKKVQIVVLGTGEDEIVDALKDLESAYPDKVRVNITFDQDLARLIMAGCDAFIMFSKYEPCGLTQMYSMARGVLPIVRGTGGLADTVQNNVTGFVFESYTEQAAFATVEQAMNIYYSQPQVWKKMMLQAMAQRFTWDNSAKGYLELYELAKSKL